MTLTAEQWRRYIDNTCSEAERKEIYTYLNSLSAEELNAMLGPAVQEGTNSIPSSLAERLDKKLEAATGIRLKQAPVIKLILRKWMAAAGIILLAGLASLYFLRSSSLPEQQLARSHFRDIYNNSTYVQKASLPDGSQVWLSPQTTLKIPADFNTHNRRLILSGQGYFEVTHDPSKPFIVMAGGLQTTVLGTHFNIEAYPRELNSTVSLTQGKVSVQARTASGNDSLIYLMPGNKLVYQVNQQQFRLEPVSSEYEQKWRNGSLVFDNLAMEDVFARLEHRFNKKIFFDREQFKGKKFTATYPHADLPLILGNMTFVQGFTYRQQKDSIIIE